jgi:hypothetical protein
VCTKVASASVVGVAVEVDVVIAAAMVVVSDRTRRTSNFCFLPCRASLTFREDCGITMRFLSDFSFSSFSFSSTGRFGYSLSFVFYGE